MALPPTPGQILSRRKKFFWGLTALVFGPIIIAWFVSGQSPSSTAPPKPEPKKPETAFERCQSHLIGMSIAGVDIAKVYGADDTLMGRARWCQAHSYQFTAQSLPSARKKN